jgi:hypothetical protein
MAIELTNAHIGQKFRITTTDEDLKPYVNKIDQTEGLILTEIKDLEDGDVMYIVKINNPEGKFINLRKSWFDMGHASLEHLMNLDGGRRRSNRKTKRRHMKKRKSRRFHR